MLPATERTCPFRSRDTLAGPQELGFARLRRAVFLPTGLAFKLRRPNRNPGAIGRGPRAAEVRPAPRRA